MIPNSHNPITEQLLDFILAAENALPQLAATLIKEFHGSLFSRNAYKLCPIYKERPDLRSSLVTTLESTAQLIIEQAWSDMLNCSPANSRLLFIAGGGQGSGKLTCCTDAPISLRKEVSLIYDASEHTLDYIKEKLKQAHEAGIQTIVVFIKRPLQHAAANTILSATDEGLIPDPDLFANSHVRSAENFLSLVAHYKKKPLFTPIVLFNEKRSEPYTLSHRELRQTLQTFSQITAIFSETWALLQSGHFPRQQSLRTLNKSRHSKNSTTTHALLCAHFLGQNLRRNIARGEQFVVTKLPSRHDVKDSASHAHYPGPTQDHLESSDNWRSQTLEGQTRTLDIEQPARVIVREKKTHEHEMLTTLER